MNNWFIQNEHLRAAFYAHDAMRMVKSNCCAPYISSDEWDCQKFLYTAKQHIKNGICKICYKTLPLSESFWVWEKKIGQQNIRFKSRISCKIDGWGSNLNVIEPNVNVGRTAAKFLDRKQICLLAHSAFSILLFRIFVWAIEHMFYISAAFDMYKQMQSHHSPSDITI